MVICSKLLCPFHGVLLVSCQSSLPPGSLRGDFSLGQKPASFAPPAPTLDYTLAAVRNPVTKPFGVNSPAVSG